MEKFNLADYKKLETFGNHKIVLIVFLEHKPIHR